MTPEGKNCAYLQKRVRSMGGDTRKVSYEGRVGAPDRLVLLPGRHFFIEMKAPGEKPRPHQLVEHERLKEAGFRVYVCDSPESIDAVLAEESEHDNATEQV